MSFTPAIRPRVRRTVEVWPPCPGQHAPSYKFFQPVSGAPSSPKHRYLVGRDPSSRLPWLRLPWDPIEQTSSLKWLTRLRPTDHWPNFPDESQSLGSPSMFLPRHPPTNYSKRSNRNPPSVDAAVWSCQASTSPIGPKRKTN